MIEKFSTFSQSSQIHTSRRRNLQSWEEMRNPEENQKYSHRHLLRYLKQLSWLSGSESGKVLNMGSSQLMRRGTLLLLACRRGRLLPSPLLPTTNREAQKCLLTAQNVFSCRYPLRGTKSRIFCITQTESFYADTNTCFKVAVHRDCLHLVLKLNNFFRVQQWHRFPKKDFNLLPFKTINSNL